MTRGLGEKQKNGRMLISYRIIYALYVKPYTYQQLWKVTKIHRNTLRQRLDQLVNDRIILKHRYNFPNDREKYYTRRDFYLLNWANKQSKEMVDYVFGNKQMHFIMDPSISKTRILSSYEINSVHVKSSRKKYSMIRRMTTTIRRPLHDPNYYGVTGEPVKKSYASERDIFERIRSISDIAKPNSSRVETDRRDKLKLVEKRDSILESIVARHILSSAQTSQVKNYRYTSKFLFLDVLDYSFLDLLIYFTTIKLYDYSRPYVKFWEIIEGSRTFTE